MERIENYDVILLGGGPSNLMTASFLMDCNLKVAIFEQNSQIGKKFLLAGKSGLNLSMDQKLDDFIDHYYQDKAFIGPFLEAFSLDNQTLFFEDTLSINTFIGSAGKRFPEEKAPFVLKTWLAYLKNKGLHVFTHHKWIESANDTHEFLDIKKDINIHIKANFAVFGFGGKSWSETGSNGGWCDEFINNGIKVNPFAPSNSGVTTNLDEFTFNKWEGSFIKNCSVSINGKTYTGEIRLGKNQLEGSPIYHANFEIRKSLLKNTVVEIQIDFKPQWTQELLESKWNSKHSLAKNLKNLKISPAFSTMLMGLNLKKAPIHYIKSLPVFVSSFGSLDKSISTIGGVCPSELNDNLSLKQQSNWFVSGEMIDWDAPTGGYLLSACFAMGKYIAKAIKTN